MEQRITPVRDGSGRVAAIEGIARDVTERRQAEHQRRLLEAQLRQAQKLEAVGTLAGGIAHDIGNLLTAISGFTTIARATLPAEHPAAESLASVEEAAARAGGISRSLLGFTREARSEKRALRLGPVVEGFVRMLRRFLPASIEIECSVVGGGDLWARADENQMHQVMFNLCINARDAMPSGGRLSIRLELTAGVAGQEGEEAKLVIEDTGHGIPEQVRERIFEPFFTTKPPEMGTGLGLAVTHGIIRDHGGSIVVESELGRGTCFIVRIPAIAAPADGGVDAEGGAEVPRGNGELVLLAEDDAMVRNLISFRLRDLNYRVPPLADGPSLVEAFQNGGSEAAAVVLDVDLPGLGGLECLRRIRERNAAVPVIVITANPSPEIEGALDPETLLLRKPFAINALAALVSGRRPAVEEES